MLNPQTSENDFMSNRFDYIGSPYEDSFMATKTSEQEWVDVYGVSYFWGEVIPPKYGESDDDPSEDENDDVLGET